MLLFPIFIPFSVAFDNYSIDIKYKLCYIIYKEKDTNRYTNKDGNKIYTTDVVVEEQEFAESKAANAKHT